MNYTREDLNADLRALLRVGLIEMIVREDGQAAYRITEKAKNMTEDEINKLIDGSQGN